MIVQVSSNIPTKCYRLADYRQLKTNNIKSVH